MAEADLRIEPIIESTEGSGRLVGPPAATIARRAESYSDFHDAAVAQARKEKRVIKKRSLGGSHQVKSLLQSNLEHGAWQHDLQEELLDASHEEYQYVARFTKSHV